MNKAFGDGHLSRCLELCQNATDEKVFAKMITKAYEGSYGLDHVVDEHRQTLLHILAGQPDTFEFWDTLLDCFVYLNSTDAKLRTPLHIAVGAHNMRVIRILVNSGASPTVEDETGMSTIHIVCKENNLKILEILLGVHCSRRYVARNLMELGNLCTEHKRMDAWRMLVECVPVKVLDEVDEDGYSIVHRLVLSHNPDALRIVLEHNADKDKKYVNRKVISTPMDLATSRGVLEVLFAFGATYNKRQPSELIMLLEKINARPEDYVGSEEMTNTDGLKPDDGALRCYLPMELHTAAKTGNIMAIKGFRGIKVDIIDGFYKTPLMYAIENEQKEAMRELLERDADPNLFTGRTTAYLFAAEKGATEQLRELYTHKQPQPGKVDWKGRDLVICAVTSCNIQCIEYVMKLTKITNESLQVVELIDGMPDEKAAGVTAALLDKGLPVDCTLKSGEYLLVSAVNNGKMELARVLLKNGVYGKLSEDITTDCFIKAVLAEMPIVEDFLTAGADPENKRYKEVPIILCTTGQKSSTTRALLVKKRPNIIRQSVDASLNTFLHVAVRAVDVVAVKEAISNYGMSVEEANQAGDTAVMALMRQASEHFEACLTELILANANMRKSNANGENVLHICAECDNVEGMRFLVEKDGLSQEDKQMLMSLKNANGETPLELASKKADIGCSAILSKIKPLPIFEQAEFTTDDIRAHFDAGYSPDVFSSDGKPLITHLMDSLYPVNPDLTVQIATLLMENGADPSLPDSEGMTPLHHAIKLGSAELVTLLVLGGSNVASLEMGAKMYADECGFPEIGKFVDGPEARACSMWELYATQGNAARTLKALLKFADRYPEIPEIGVYMDDVKIMQRLLSMFVDRLGRVTKRIMPDGDSIGEFLLYFVDAFLPLVGMSACFDEVNTAIKDRHDIEKEPIGHDKLSVADALIVPTQQFTRYGDLIKTIIKRTPDNHPEIPTLQKAYRKYTYVGRTSSDAKQIAESQKELESISLLANIADTMTRFYVNDMLYCRGHFERKMNFTEPINDDKVPKASSALWGLHIMEAKTGQLVVPYFAENGTSMKSFLAKQKITIMMFRKYILFGHERTAGKFKLKFSCRSSEVFWDFGQGPDVVQIFAPFGRMMLKVAPLKKDDAAFERNRWRNDVNKQLTWLATNEDEEETQGGVEVCYVSWVGKFTQCVHSQLFHVTCKTEKRREEAQQKIMDKFAEMQVSFEDADTSAGRKPLINFDFQTVQSSQIHDSDVISEFFD